MNGDHFNRIAKTLAEVFRRGFRRRVADLVVAARLYAEASMSREHVSPQQQTRVMNRLRRAATALWQWDHRYRDCPVHHMEVPAAVGDLVVAALSFGRHEVEIVDVAKAALEFVKNQLHGGG